MNKNIILGLVLFFVIMAGLSFWIVGSIDGSAAAAKGRKETDFTTQRFVVSQLWQMDKKQNNSVLISYLYIKVNNEPVNLRLPWSGSATDQETIAEKINKGDTIEVKVRKAQLEAARENGLFKVINRFIMGDKREVTIYKLVIHNQVLVDKDIHGWDEAEITLLNRLTENPFILLIPAFFILFIIGYIKRKTSKTPTT